MENQVKEIVDKTLDKLKQLANSDCIIGKEIKCENNEIIIPICKASVGFVSGGGEYSSACIKKTKEFPFAGGSSAGCSITPIGFLVVGKTVQYISTNSDDMFSKIYNFASKICEDIKKA